MLNLTFWRAPMIKNPAQAYAPSRLLTLAQAQAGKTVKVAGFGKLSTSQRQHLQAYGLLPGRSVEVLAQRPVTIILIEQTELAFEKDIAAQVIIE